ncbi:cation:proton antiporter subunit C [Synechococcus sp. RSCCF101]|uniref:cation:proton antiporter subunit C n=1 Tax=Synechococcus sp. RSCCF101 TaxID=2511069 RepID=UPI0017872FA8|nr:cation:proton antiporter subunit C [Synechococcus sp. RSCCF101]
MNAFRLLAIPVLLTLLAGFLGLMRQRNLLLKALAMDVMGTGVISLFVLVGARHGLRSPILNNASGLLSEGPAGTAYWADPLPQAVILTAIVIGFSIQALLMVVIARLAERDPSLDLEALERIEP